jgi:hypothetical protein
MDLAFLRRRFPELSFTLWINGAPFLPFETEASIMKRCDSQLRQSHRTIRAAWYCRGPLFSVVLLAGPIFGGCEGARSSPPTYEVKGKVLLRNGKALNAGRVTFIADDGLRPEATGEIGADGAFALTTRSRGDGAAPGTYKVRIEPAENKNPRKIRLSFPVKYVDEDSSGLVVTVRAEPNRLEPFTLK